MHLPAVHWEQLEVLQIRLTHIFFRDSDGLLSTLSQCVRLKELSLYVTPLESNSRPPARSHVTLPVLVFLDLEFDVSHVDGLCHFFDNLLLPNLRSLHFKCYYYFSEQRERPVVSRCIERSRSPVSFLHIEIADMTLPAVLSILHAVSPTLQELRLDTWIEFESISTLLTALIVPADCDPRDVLCPKLEIFSLEYCTLPSKD
jgi:hypothetical protein